MWSMLSMGGGAQKDCTDVTCFTGGQGPVLVHAVALCLRDFPGISQGCRQSRLSAQSECGTLRASFLHLASGTFWLAMSLAFPDGWNAVARVSRCCTRVQPTCWMVRDGSLAERHALGNVCLPTNGRADSSQAGRVNICRLRRRSPFSLMATPGSSVQLQADFIVPPSIVAGAASLSFTASVQAYGSSCMAGREAVGTTIAIFGSFEISRPGGWDCALVVVDKRRV
jgi:hypothetical protein